MSYCAREVYDSLLPHQRQQCKISEQARLEITSHYKWNEIETTKFYQLCSHDFEYSNEKQLKSINKIDKEYESVLRKDAKIINDSQNIKIHPILSNWYCFKSEKSKKCKIIKEIALIINDWPWRALNELWKNKSQKLYKIVSQIARIKMDIIAKYDEYTHLKITKYLDNLDINDVILSQTNDGISNFIDKLSFRFRFNVRKYEDCLLSLQTLKKSIEDSFISLGIGKRDNKTDKIRENCVFSFYDMSLRRPTDITINKTLYNYLDDMLANSQQKINCLQKINRDIETKRRSKKYREHLEPWSEKQRAKRHKKKHDTNNATPNTNAIKKNKKNKNKNNKKKSKSNILPSENGLHKYFSSTSAENNTNSDVEIVTMNEKYEEKKKNIEKAEDKKRKNVFSKKEDGPSLKKRKKMLSDEDNDDDLDYINSAKDQSGLCPPNMQIRTYVPHENKLNEINHRSDEDCAIM